MAASGDKSIELSVMDRQWIVKALELQRTSLGRAMKNELPGSEISALRKKEIEQVSSIISKVSV